MSQHIRERSARRVAAFLAQLDQADGKQAEQAESEAARIRQALERIKQRLVALDKAKVELDEGKTRVGLTDADSVMRTKNGSTVVVLQRATGHGCPAQAGRGARSDPRAQQPHESAMQGDPGPTTQHHALLACRGDGAS